MPLHRLPDRPLRRHLITALLLAGLWSAQSAEAADGRIVILTELKPRQAVGGEPVVFNETEIRSDVQTDPRQQITEQIGRLNVTPQVQAVHGVASAVDSGTQKIANQPLQKGLQIDVLTSRDGVAGALKMPLGIALRFEQHSGAVGSASATGVAAATGVMSAADDVLASSHADISIAPGMSGATAGLGRALDQVPTAKIGSTVQGALSGLGSKTNGAGDLAGGVSRATGALGSNLSGQITGALGGLSQRIGGAR
jgi:hypothetical protein